MDKFQVADEQVVARGGGQPTYIPSNVMQVPVITPANLDRGVIDKALSLAVRSGQVQLSQSQGQWIAEFW